MKLPRLYVDWPWSEDVRDFGAPVRAHLHMPNGGMWMFGVKSQVYDRRTKTYTDRWSYLSYRPPLDRP